MAIIPTQPSTHPVTLSRRISAIYWPAVLWSALAGGAGGLVGWFPGEVIDAVPSPNVYVAVFLYFAMVSAGLGAVLGALPGLLNRSRRQAVRGAVIGAVVGCIGGGVAALPAQWTYMTLGYGVLARGVAWGINGAGIGLCPGAATRDIRRSARGLVAGLVGGFAAGLLFELVWAILPHGTGDTGTSSRFVADLVLGICIGIAVALIEAVARNAWLSVLSGRREGAQFIVSKEITSIGRDDRDDILLWGDPQLALRHAALTRTRRGYLLQPLTPEAPTLVNHHLIQGPTVLEDGDEVTVGATHLLFRTHRPMDQAADQQTSLAAAAPVHVDSQSTDRVVQQVTPGAMAARPLFPPVERDSAAPAAVAEAGSAPFRLVGLSAGAGTNPLGPGGPVRIGRDARNDVVLTDETVSAHHAELRWEDNQWVVYDLGSTNGTFVSYTGTRAEERPVSLRNALRPGSTVRFGNVAFRLESSGPFRQGDAPPGR